MSVHVTPSVERSHCRGSLPVPPAPAARMAGPLIKHTPAIWPTTGWLKFGLAIPIARLPCATRLMPSNFSIGYCIPSPKSHGPSLPVCPSTFSFQSGEDARAARHCMQVARRLALRHVVVGYARCADVPVGCGYGQSDGAEADWGAEPTPAAVPPVPVAVIGPVA